MKIFYISLISFLLMVETNLSAQPIISKPILFTEKRIKLTQQYREEHYGIKDHSITILPKIIVLHWTNIPTFAETFKFFDSEILSIKLRADIKSGGLLNVSVPYVVDRDGTIYKLMPDNWMARHVIGLNNIAIGIENVGGVGGKDDLTEKQLEANIYLIRMLKKKYPSIEYLIGHFEYGTFRETPLWQEKNKNYFTHKYDPSPRFMAKVRKAVADLNLKSAYVSEKK